MLGIPNYEPTFFDNPDVFIQAFGDDLSKIIGCTLEDYWFMWDKEDDEWFSWGTIVFKIANHQFEFATFNEEFSLSLDKIDLNQDLDLYGAGENNLLIWNSKCHKEVNNLIGRKITDINIIAYNSIREVLYSEYHPESVGQKFELGFMLHGIEFEFEKSNLADNNHFLQIYNAVNELGILTTKQEIDEQTKKISLIKRTN